MLNIHPSYKQFKKQRLNFGIANINYHHDGVMLRSLQLRFNVFYLTKRGLISLPSMGLVQIEPTTIDFKFY